MLTITFKLYSQQPNYYISKPTTLIYYEYNVLPDSSTFNNLSQYTSFISTLDSTKYNIVVHYSYCIKDNCIDESMREIRIKWLKCYLHKNTQFPLTNFLTRYRDDILHIENCNDEIMISAVPR